MAKKPQITLFYAIFVLTLILVIFLGCGKPFKKQPVEAANKISFRNIPGITQSEIKAIEEIRGKYDSFVYGMYPSIEAFIGKDGKPTGYTVTLCNWLSEIFEIPFKPVYYQWGDLLRGLESGKIDFTDEIMTSSANQTKYLMTSPMIHRTIKIYRIHGDRSIEEIRRTRKPRYVFLWETVVISDIRANLDYDFVAITVDNHDEAYKKLKNGEADAFFGVDTAEGYFDAYGDVTNEEFFPLIIRSSSLVTQKEELQPIISAMEKAMDINTLEYLTKIQDTGYQKYRENKMYTQLTEEERSYIKNNPVIKVSADFSNYPISFFSRDKKWEGIYFEVLDTIAKLTGLTFEAGNDQNMPLLETIDRVEKGEMLMLPELHQTEEYEGRFIWSEVPILKDHFAFVSRANFRNIDLNDIFHLHVALRKGTIYKELFKKMFPTHQNFTEYDTMENVWDALKRGDVDVIFCSQRRLIIYTNYYEQSDFKLNLVFDSTFDSLFAYNKDAVILKSIVDKALRIININNISNQWIYKTYDYRNKLAAAQRPWLISALILFSLVFILVTYLLIKTRTAGKHMERLIKIRTSNLAFETSKLQTIIASIPDFIFCKDVDFRYTQCNHSFEQYLGITEADIIGKTDKDGNWMLPEHADMIHETEKSVMEEDRKRVIEEEVDSSLTGKRCVFETVKAPIRQDNVVVGMVGIVRDITKRKEMEEDLIAASRAKSSFLAHMSHELRTPLNVVIGLTDSIMEDSNISDEAKENISKIANASNTLLIIVNDILDFSKIESGKLSLKPIEYYVSSMLNDIITITITRLWGKNITFRLNIEDNLPLKLYGDDLRVKQIFINLLNNAVKYTQEGSIELTVSCTRENNIVWLDAAVSDTGIGIPKEDIKNLFLDYYQAITNTNRKIEGTGLGLSISKELAEMMNGEIKVESEYGNGSTFSFRIKQGYVDDKIIGADTSEKLRNFCYLDDIRTAHKKLERLDLSYAKVLVVDDMQTNLDVASILLRKYKIEVDCLTGGQFAIDKIRNGIPVYSAIFMDHMMPGMDGIETADKIRALGTEYAKKIPIIALTANAVQGTENLFLEHDFQAFLTKPIDVMEMDRLIRKYVRDDKHDNIPISGEFSSEGENVPIEISGVDTKKGLSLYVGEAKLYIPLLRSYAANTPEILNKMRSVSAENLSEYVITVHGLKGTSAGIGAKTICDEAFELEKLSKAGDLQGVLAKNGRLIADSEIVVENIKTWLTQYDANNAKPRKKAPDRKLLAQLRQSCENYDMSGIDKVMLELENYNYEEDADLVRWLKEKIGISEIKETAQRLAQYEKESSK